MKKSMAMLATALLALNLTACNSMSNQDAGVITGGVVGGLLGNTVGGGSGRVVATTIGAIAGSMIGGHIGAAMDAQDQARVMTVLESGPTREVVVWTNPDSRVTYEVMPTQTYYRQHSGMRQPCRVYVTKARIDGRVQEMTGRACRGPNGTWQIVS